MTQQLAEWIQHPERLERESLFTLRSWLTHYPYFQTARLLYLKNLYMLQDPLFKEELRKSALYIADLSVLFYYIEGERFRVEPHVKSQQEELKGGGDRTLDLIDRFLSGANEKLNVELSLPVEVATDYTKHLEHGFDNNVDHTESSQEMEGQKLIDDFIKRQEKEQTTASLYQIPSLQPVSDHEPSNDNVDSLVEDEGDGQSVVTVVDDRPDDEENYFTETLAKIYIRQHRYEKALEIIKKLNLKYPKKNTYFADQIRFLEKLIINAKSK